MVIADAEVLFQYIAVTNVSPSIKLKSNVAVSFKTPAS
jgi:hypothetical protein